jgi:hypothetical protein
VPVGSGLSRRTGDGALACAGGLAAGFVPTARTVCADSGQLVVDPPGLLAISREPPELAFATYRPAFAPGDTVVVLDYHSEGYWTVQWRDSITIAYGYWDTPDSAGGRIVRPAQNVWWVHLTDRASGARGWILRARWGGPGRDTRGWELVEGGEMLSGERVAPCR